MTEPGLSMEQMIARAAQRQAGAEQIMADLQTKIESVKQAQQQALRATGEATSRDGCVHVVVDATGVVTQLRFAATAFETTTPDRLAQTVVATIQTAATQARNRMAATLAPLRDESSPATEAAAKSLAALGIERPAVPEVPRTAVDPTVVPAWGGPQRQQSRPDWGAIAPDPPAYQQAPRPPAPHQGAHPAPQQPMRGPAHRPHHRPSDADTDAPDDWTADQRPW